MNAIIWIFGGLLVLIALVITIQVRGDWSLSPVEHNCFRKGYTERDCPACLREGRV